MDAARAMAAIGGAVAAASAAAPQTFVRAFGIPPREVTGAATLGWRRGPALDAIGAWARAELA